MRNYGGVPWVDLRRSKAITPQNGEWRLNLLALTGDCVLSSISFRRALQSGHDVVFDTVGNSIADWSIATWERSTPTSACVAVDRFGA